MKLTGTLIEDLMATVERAEQRAQSGTSAAQAAGEPMFGETCPLELLFPSIQDNAGYDSKFLGVA